MTLSTCGTNMHLQVLHLKPSHLTVKHWSRYRKPKWIKSVHIMREINLLGDVVVVAGDAAQQAAGLRDRHAHLADAALHRGDAEVAHLRQPGNCRAWQHSRNVLR